MAGQWWCGTAATTSRAEGWPGPRRWSADTPSSSCTAQKLRGGFALQRTRAGLKSQWLLVKRRDEEARPGSDVAAELPASVLSGRTIEELLRERR